MLQNIRTEVFIAIWMDNALSLSVPANFFSFISRFLIKFARKTATTHYRENTKQRNKVFISKVSSISRLWSSVALVLISLISAPFCHAQSNPGEVDIFAGVKFDYRDIYFNRLFDVLVQVTPGVRWCFAEGWDAAAQVYVPVYNTFGPAYKAATLNTASVSYQTRLGRKWAVKGSAGIFSDECYGLDFKSMYMATSWLALEGELGLCGYGRYTLTRIDYSEPTNVCALAGGAIWLKPWSVLMRGRAGRYVYGDWGCDAEAMRHYKHTTVGIKARWSTRIGPTFGFNITVMLPPYQRKRRKVNIRPAADFELNYINRSDYHANVTYRTDPEENARQGWFDYRVAPWGLNAERPDFAREHDQHHNANDTISHKERQ